MIATSWSSQMQMVTTDCGVLEAKQQTLSHKPSIKLSILPTVSRLPVRRQFFTLVRIKNVLLHQCAKDVDMP